MRLIAIKYRFDTGTKIYDGYAPTLTANDTGGAEDISHGIMVMKVKQIGNIAKENGFSNPQRGRVYDIDGISPCLSTMQGGAA